LAGAGRVGGGVETGRDVANCVVEAAADDEVEVIILDDLDEPEALKGAAVLGVRCVKSEEAGGTVAEVEEKVEVVAETEPEVGAEAETETDADGTSHVAT
jgi:hypothetical protein